MKQQTTPFPDGLADRFEITAQAMVAETAIARVWRAQDPSGRLRAVKIWRSAGRANEGPGVALMKAWAGRPVVGVLDETPDAVLMEWLEGPSLGDRSRDGHDMAAAEALARVACDLQAGPVRVPGLVSLEDWCAALLGPEPPALRRDPEQRLIGQARDTLRHLLATAPEPVALHGDLHHDNIRRGPRGFTAFDAKGLRGDPAFELANAFAHPKGIRVAEPGRVQAMATIWSGALGCDRHRLLRWAFAKVALSVVWQARKHEADPQRMALLRSLAGMVHD